MRLEPTPLPMTLAGRSVLLAFVLTLCLQGTATPAEPVRKSYETQGVVREVAADRRKAVVRHEEIPGYMPRMTMELNVRNPRELEGVKAGDEILFRLVDTGKEHWIESVRKSGHRDTNAVSVAKPARPAVAELKPGDVMPDFQFTAEDGGKRRLESYRGKALAFTFFFTRCPLPEFCPRMSKSFAKARELIQARTSGPTNWQFLCLSFDQTFDQPKVLAGYASAYRGKDKEGWLFGALEPAVLATVAPRLDFMVTAEGGSFSHNLRTVVLDTQGRVHRQFDGNEWTPEQLAEAVVEAAQR